MWGSFYQKSMAIMNQAVANEKLACPGIIDKVGF